MRFLLTPLREGRRLTLEQLEMRVHISTHAPAGGATSGAGANGIARSHFYSRPCGRGDAHGRTYGSFRQISTHAPAGGATPPLPGGPTTYSFLLTPLREGRRQHVFLKVRNGIISTHAPAGGATRGHFQPDIHNRHFYSRPCGRGDPLPPRLVTRKNNFYSRPCGRGDSGASTNVKPLPISTHAPAGGATARGKTWTTREILFLLTPLREGRRDCARRGGGSESISTHAPAGGATIAGDRIVSSNIAFLLTPLREGRPGATCFQTAAWLISTHAPAGGATAA